MHIAGWQKVSLVDYPGKVACTLFTGGCNLRCPYCHNSELLEGEMPSQDKEEVMAYLDVRKGIQDGVVISGGDPCLQSDLDPFLARLKEKARGYGVSITEYLTAVLLKVIADKQHRERPRRERPVALAIPINLRGWFPSETLRNFILTVRPSIDPSLGEYTFVEVSFEGHHYLRLIIYRQQMQAAIAGYVKFTTNPLLQLVPIVLKNPDMSLGY